MTNDAPNPVLAEVIRNGRVESCHRGSVVAVDRSGDVVYAVGDVGRDIYPRSSLKFFQAIPLVESGAARRFGLTAREIALACASHNAEPMHVDTVRAWLATIGLSEAALENGVAYPGLDADRDHLSVTGESPTKAHHNCSGKHSGMLTVAMHKDFERAGYSEHVHPVQRLWMAALSELVELDIAALHWERDGCGMPAIMMPMRALAWGNARLSQPQHLGNARAEAVTTIMESITAHPEMIAGSKRCCTDLIRATGGAVIVKTGAEAVYTAMVPRLGLGLAIKIDDGSTRGSEVALGAILRKLDIIDQTTYRALDACFNPAILNSQGYRTGNVRPADF